MIIILHRIPENTQKHEIIEHLATSLEGSFFKKTGHIEDIKILTFENMLNNTREYHALVTIDSEAAANRVIKQLNRKPFKNKNIAIREYIFRSWHRDRRINTRQYNEELKNKRIKNRRGYRLKLLDEDPVKQVNTGNFHRKL